MLGYGGKHHPPHLSSKFQNSATLVLSALRDRMYPARIYNMPSLKLSEKDFKCMYLRSDNNYYAIHIALLT